MRWSPAAWTPATRRSQRWLADGGLAMGEAPPRDGAGILVLEPVQAARRRGVPVRGRILGHAAGFTPERDAEAAAVRAAVASALEDAGVRPGRPVAGDRAGRAADGGAHATGAAGRLRRHAAARAASGGGVRRDVRGGRPAGARRRARRRRRPGAVPRARRLPERARRRAGRSGRCGSRVSQLAGHRVLVTGGSRGIGRAIALACAARRRGGRVQLLARRGRQRGRGDAGRPARDGVDGARRAGRRRRRRGGEPALRRPCARRWAARPTSW